LQLSPAALKKFTRSGTDRVIKIQNGNFLHLRGRDKVADQIPPPPFFRAENGTNKMQKHGEPGPLRILFRKFHRLKLHRFNQQTGHAEQHSGKFLIA
jgi:hypothetical protein